MTRARARRAAWLAVAMLAAAPPAGAERFWPRRPQPAAPAIEARSEAEPARTGGDPVRLQVQRRGGAQEIIADNAAAGPMQVRLALASADNARPVPALPATAVVATGQQRVLARVYALDPRQPPAFDVRLEQVPGDPGARPHDVRYGLPFGQAPVRVDQGFGGRFSHADPSNFYAVDFALPEGTPVLAARDGVVMQVHSDFEQGGQDREHDSGAANYVRILHDDGSMALYGHLQAGGVAVRVGEQVRQGQRIGHSGNTGFSTAPHLHFVVQANRGMRLEAIPFRMFSAQGELKFAREDAAGPR